MTTNPLQPVSINYACGATEAPSNNPHVARCDTCRASADAAFYWYEISARVDDDTTEAPVVVHREYAAEACDASAEYIRAGFASVTIRGFSRENGEAVFVAAFGE